MDLGLKGRAALLTASSQGIGRAVARRFAEEGARLLLCSRSEDKLLAVKEELAAGGAKVEVFAGDVRDAEACAAMVGRCEELYGAVDVLFTNAGGPPAGGFQDHDAAAYRDALDLNLLSVVHLCRATVPGMITRGFGRVVALTSMSVRQPVDGLLLSNTARAGVQGFLKSLANEVARHGITVNNVCPGYTRTDRLLELSQARAQREGTEPQAVIDEWAASTPAHRVGEPDEVAAAVAFLASVPAAYINGVTLAVDGGAVRSLL